MKNSTTRNQAAIHWQLYVAFAIWGSLVLLGSCLLWRYANRPGDTGITPSTWPRQSQLPRAELGPTLIMFAHPLCPCTSASVTELEKILHHTDRQALVVFWQPGQADPSWQENSLVTHCRGNASILVVQDPAGSEAKRFGVLTSGHCLVYDRDGQLVYQGGITGERGHLGMNAGQQSVQRLMSDTPVTAQQPPLSDGPPLSLGGNRFPVFGCSLHYDADR